MSQQSLLGEDFITVTFSATNTVPYQGQLPFYDFDPGSVRSPVATRSSDDIYATLNALLLYLPPDFLGGPGSWVPISGTLYNDNPGWDLVLASVSNTVNGFQSTPNLHLAQGANTISFGSYFIPSDAEPGLVATGSAGYAASRGNQGGLAYSIYAVPEPGSLSLLGFCLGVLAVLRLVSTKGVTTSKTQT